MQSASNKTTPALRVKSHLIDKTKIEIYSTGVLN